MASPHTGSQPTPTPPPQQNVPGQHQPTMRTTTSSSTLNPKSQSFSFFQTDEVASTSHYPYGHSHPAYHQPGMRDSNHGSHPQVINGYRGSDYAGYGGMQEQHWNGASGAQGGQQRGWMPNGVGSSSNGGAGAGRYYAGTLSPPRGPPQGYASTSMGVYFPLQQGPPSPFTPSPTLLPPFQPTRPSPPPPTPPVTTSVPPTTTGPSAAGRVRRLRPPPPGEAPALSFGPGVRPPPGTVFPDVALGQPSSSKAPSTVTSATAAEVSTSPPPRAVETPPPTIAASSKPIPPVLPTPAVVPIAPIPLPGTPTTTTISTAPSSHSSPLLTPRSPTTTISSLSEDVVPSTPKTVLPAASKPSSVKMSWADLVRSPGSSSPAPLSANGTPLSPITQHIPPPLPVAKLTLAQLLQSPTIRSESRVRKGKRARGLINNGNLCFANAILQVLVYCEPFWDLVERIGEVVGGDLGGRMICLDAMINFLSEFKHVENANPLLPSSSSDPFIPTQVYESLKANPRFDAMRRGTQEDAEEFLGFFLETLHEELLGVLDREEEGKKAVAVGAVGGEDWLEVGSKGRTATTRTTESRESPITRIFGGQLRSVLRCSGQKDSITLEPYQRLQLDIQPPHIKTIEDALHSQSLPEHLPDFQSRTGARVEATKQVYLESFPPVLILHLKRFVFDNVGGVGKCSKRVGYGMELEVGERKGGRGRVGYRLFGVVYHHGKSAQGGHYTVAVRPAPSPSSAPIPSLPPPSSTSSTPATKPLVPSEWIHIDDTSIRSISESEVVSGPRESDGSEGDKGAYLLLYTRL